MFNKETYAYTLAVHMFRIMIAVAVHFDLEIAQGDVNNTFLHTDLPPDMEIYVELPLG